MIDNTIDKYLNEIKFKRFDDVHIISKNKTGMIYSMNRNNVVVKTVGGMIKATIDDLEKVSR